ncbi:aminoacyl-tRNA deacylase [Microvirga sp. G4-2]|uniref:aminoacyl-tRNA deacylase n=1 Tax=Microvirga sp. G4-2 TaxID=3434467 RepID=UPI004044C132
MVPHERTLSALGSAHAGHIPSDRLAKAVVLSDGGRYTLAVLPASHHLRLSDLRMEIGHEVHLATEPEAAEVFRDCALGAVPAVGACYGLDVIIDNSIDPQQELYFEGGDHAALINVNRTEFARLNPQAQHGSFSAYD